MRQSGMFKQMLSNLSPVVRAFLMLILGIHIVVLITSLISASASDFIYLNFGLIPSTVLTHPWTVLTSVVLHERNGLLHLLFNGLALLSLGPWVERGLGQKRFVTLMLISALSGSALFIIVQFLKGTPGTMVIGASGAVIGVLTAFALMFPEAELQLFGLTPLKAKNLIWLIIGIDIIVTILGAGIASSAHFGGLLGAFAYIKRPWRPQYIADVRRRLERLKSRL